MTFTHTCYIDHSSGMKRGLAVGTVQGIASKKSIIIKNLIKCCWNFTIWNNLVCPKRTDVPFRHFTEAHIDKFGSYENVVCIQVILVRVKCYILLYILSVTDKI